jgi:hypothetical protein
MLDKHTLYFHVTLARLELHKHTLYFARNENFKKITKNSNRQSPSFHLTYLPLSQIHVEDKCKRETTTANKVKKNT